MSTVDPTTTKRPKPSPENLENNSPVSPKSGDKKTRRKRPSFGPLPGVTVSATSNKPPARGGTHVSGNEIAPSN